VTDASSKTHHLVLVEDVGQVAAATVLTILHGGHEDTGTALRKRLAQCRLLRGKEGETHGLVRALATKTLDLAIRVDLVVLEDSELGLLALVLDLLGGGVDLLLSLLATTTEAQHEMKSALLLDVVVGESAAVFELLAGEDQTLLVWGNALLVCDPS